MRKKTQTIIITVSIFLLAAFVGCSMFQDGVIPCYVEPEAIKYTAENPTTWLPFTTLFDAKRIQKKAEYIHLMTLLELDRKKEDENLLYAPIADGLVVNIKAATGLKQTVFDPDGTVGLLVTCGLGLGLGGLLIKRPQEKELERKVNGNQTV